MTPPVAGALPRGAYWATALVAGALIAFQIAVMRLFAVGSWAHFGSLVVSLAMFGFGLTSAAMSVADPWFRRRWNELALLSLASFPPLAVGCNLLAQQVGFNAIFLVSDPTQKWRLAATMLLYLMPFLSGALFLGVVFQRAQAAFNRVYFADLLGSGLGGLALLATLYVVAPADLVVFPIALWLAGALCWTAATGPARRAIPVVVASVASIAAHLLLPGWLGVPSLAVSDYKGVSYARKFPDSRLVLEHRSPFGLLEVYESSYLHFAPGLSDNAAFNLEKMPERAYWGLYVDGEGPQGIIRSLPAKETGYYRFLPMVYPYLLRKAPETFVVQFGGGLSTALALASGSRHVTVAESERGVLDAFLNHPELRAFTGDILRRPDVTVIPHDGRLHLAGQRDRYDVIDLSLADSTGLSSPGGFAIVEKFAYTREAMAAYMRALRPGGILSVTTWTKEEPPKSVLRLYATMAAAAREVGGPDIARRFFVVSSYLSTTTVLYARDGFQDAEVEALRRHSAEMSFDEIHVPGAPREAEDVAGLLRAYREQIFGSGEDDAAGAGAPAADGEAMPSTRLARAAWRAHVDGTWPAIARDYVFDAHPLTNARPYFAAYLRAGDLPRVLDRLDTLPDEGGYRRVWATLALACIAAASLVALPVLFGWRAAFATQPGKLAAVVYFACLGLGYIVVEVGLIAQFVMALGNATISASVLITGMLVFSGLGALASERVRATGPLAMPAIFASICALLLAYGLGLDRVLDAIGTLDYGLRLACCFLIVLPPAFLMGFPMPVAMNTLATLGKQRLFIWAWGINGCFSVIGAALVPILATSIGLDGTLAVCAVAYALAGACFGGLLRPLPAAP